MIKWHGDAFLRSAENEVEKAIAIGTIKVQREAQRLVNQVAGPTKDFPDRPVSKPGEPPHIRTGTLKVGIDEETFRRGSEFVGRVGPTGPSAKYGSWLEEGTRKMAKRPYLRPALDAMRNEIVDAITDAGGRMKGG